MDKDTIFISPLRNLPEVILKGIKKIQKNPNASLTESQSRKRLSTLTLITGAMLVIAILFISGMKNVIENQKSGVSASINMKHAFKGIVYEVDLVNNSFTVEVVEAYDEKIKSDSQRFWTVILPPGENLRETKLSNSACYIAPNFNSNLSDKESIACAVIVRPKLPIVVEYLILDQERGRMVAKTVIGTY